VEVDARFGSDSANSTPLFSGRSINFSCLLESLIFGCLLWRSLATLATSSYVCCALRPVIASVIVFGMDGSSWPNSA
jgi:hypothetical protein